jgi:hypothetical protein
MEFVLFVITAQLVKMVLENVLIVLLDTSLPKQEHVILTVLKVKSE